MALSLVPHDHGTGLFSPPKAPQACGTCKKQKRKCDKSLPACGLCVRMSRICDYSNETPPVPTADDFASLQNKLAELEQRLNAGNGSPATYHDAPMTVSSGSNHVDMPPPQLSSAPLRAGGSRFPATYFLDIEAFKWAGITVPKANVDTPQEVLELLGDSNAVQAVSAEYFSTIHMWLPIISKKRINLSIALWDGGSDLALLFLAMRLIVSQPVEGVEYADNPVYCATKRYLALLEASGAVSLMYLQAMILMALYEYGHCIYPAAWMTVGACARYAEFLGLPAFRTSIPILGQPTTWTEAEERRRGWWAVYCLDRIISLGSKKKFALPDPPESELYPASDAAWDEGDMGAALQTSLAVPVSDRATPFMRLCQVCLLISRSTAYCRAAMRPGARCDVATMTHALEGLHAYCTAVEADLSAAGAGAGTGAGAGAGADAGHGYGLGGPDAYLALLAPRCLAWSAMIMVLDLHSCPEYMRDEAAGDLDAPQSLAELELKATAVEGLKRMSQHVRDVCGELLGAGDQLRPAGRRGAGIGGGGLGKVSPLAFNAMYCAMATLFWLWHEGGKAVDEQSLATTKKALEMLGSRWRLALHYTRMQEHHAMTVSMAMQAGLGS